MSDEIHSPGAGPETETPAQPETAAIESEPAPAPETAPEPPAKSEAAKESGSFSYRRKMALISYLAGLFVLVFVVVFVFTAGGGADKGAAEKLETLQEENQALKDRILELETEGGKLKDAVVNLLLQSEYWESGAQDDAVPPEMRNQYDAMCLLLRAQQGYFDEDAGLLRSAMAELEDERYLYLTDEGLNVYYYLLEYMEQPYFGEKGE